MKMLLNFIDILAISVLGSVASSVSYHEHFSRMLHSFSFPRSDHQDENSSTELLSFGKKEKK